MRRLKIQLIVFIFAVFTAFPGQAKNLKISIYHTNDIHGWIMARPASFSVKSPGRLIGGAAALAQVYRADPGLKLLVDAGDWYQGTPEGTLTKGRALADIFNAVPYDAVEVGNHEYDFGEESLKTVVKGIRVPVLGGNVYEEKTSARVSYLTPWIVKEVGGVKIGLFGLLTSNMRHLTFAKNIKGLEFGRETAAARAAVKALRARGCDVIIAVTHVGFENRSKSYEGDQTVADSVEGIDLIVGGHSHTPIKRPERHGPFDTLIVQAGSQLTVVGKVTLEVDPATKKVVSAEGRLINLWIDEVGQDPEILKIVERHSREAGQALEVVLATATATLSSGRGTGSESALGDWMTDCFRSWSGTDVAFQNAGGIRSNMPAGPVTLRALFNIMPFENYLVKLQMKGRLIQEVLEHGAGENGMVQFSGLKVSYNMRKPRGERVVSVSVGDRRLEPEAVYSVAAADFMVQGGDGFTPFGRAQKTEPTEMLLRDVLGWCAGKQPLITPAPLNRISFRGD